MSSFLSKLRTTILGSAHDLLDKAIDLNSPSAVRQYVRDLEDALDRLKTEAAVQAGQLRTLEREITELGSKIDTGKATIVKLNAAGHTDLARAKATEVVRWQQVLLQKQQALETQRKMSADLDSSVQALDAKHTELVFQLRHLESLDRDSKASEASARALQAAGRLTNTGDSISVDDVTSRMVARNDVAHEKLRRAMGDIQTADADADTTAAVDDLMESLKPKETVGKPNA